MANKTKGSRALEGRLCCCGELARVVESSDEATAPSRHKHLKMWDLRQYEPIWCSASQKTSQGGKRAGNRVAKRLNFIPKWMFHVEQCWADFRFDFFMFHVEQRCSPTHSYYQEEEGQVIPMRHGVAVSAVQMRTNLSWDMLPQHENSIRRARQQQWLVPHKLAACSLLQFIYIPPRRHQRQPAASC
jgi:hypothetical protein